MNRAIVRKPASNLKDGLTTASLGPPNHELAGAQHRAYCVALEKCGLELVVLEADENYPDSTFVEDTAVLAKQCAILTRPGAPSRAGEVDSITLALSQSFTQLEKIDEPGTLDGGDVCEVGNHYFIGISERTNEAGAEQLSRYLRAFSLTSSLIDIRGLDGLLHLKSGLASLGDGRLVVTESLASRKEFAEHELIRVEAEEEYAANCVRINDHVLVARGYSKLERMLIELGYQTISLEMSEFQKLDGGLSCLSLRF
ncbi:MAG TPA: arginine deiminase-related protein [Pyrinomonadaceae bacterium]|nr:arginine deiminase-related protein [Pyrinomonadaceae bacterium]